MTRMEVLSQSFRMFTQLRLHTGELPQITVKKVFVWVEGVAGKWTEKVPNGETGESAGEKRSAGERLAVAGQPQPQPDLSPSPWITPLSGGL